MEHWTYLVLLVGCLLVTAPLELVLRARVYARWRSAVRAIAPVAGCYVLWDLVGIARGHWSYSPRRLVGVWFGPIPLEELLFFAVVPICALLTYEAVGTVVGWVRRRA